MVVTNATVSKRFEELAKLPKELLSHLFFKFSYHYLELKQRNLLDKFFAMYASCAILEPRSLLKLHLMMS